MQREITLREIYQARLLVGPFVSCTPLPQSPALSVRLGTPVHLKLELMQTIGSFKIRGAANHLLSLSAAQRERGVVTVSTGNHGRAVAAAARQLGVRAVVCMSELVPENKRAAIRDLGAELLIVGRSQDDAEVEANRLVEQQAMVPMHPFDDPKIIAGQGTIGLELLEQLPAIDNLVVGLSGGGNSGLPTLCLNGPRTTSRIDSEDTRPFVR